MLSMAPPVLPIRKQPGLMPPTVAGPKTKWQSPGFSFNLQYLSHRGQRSSLVAHWLWFQGTTVQILVGDKKFPLLFWSYDIMIAVNFRMKSWFCKVTDYAFGQIMDPLWTSMELYSKHVCLQIQLIWWPCHEMYILEQSYKIFDKNYSKIIFMGNR